MAQKSKDAVLDYFRALAEVFSRATGLVATVIDVKDNRLPDCYGSGNFLVLPLIQGDKLFGYIICDHHKSTDNHHRAAAIRLLNFIINNISAAAANPGDELSNLPDTLIHNDMLGGSEI
mgnify:CR=1 FL=1